MPAPLFVLASASPRRRDLLAALGLSYVVEPAGVDETVPDDWGPERLVTHLAEAKARAVAGRRPAALVLGADTVVVRRGRILGKPRDRAQAARMLEALAGRTHFVYTGLCLVPPAGAEPVTDFQITEVTFSPMSEEERTWYLEIGEWEGKAGGYAVQGLGAVFILGVTGSYSNVVGLPLETFYRLLDRAGYRLRDFVDPTASRSRWKE